MKIEALTKDNVAEVQAWLKETGGKPLQPGWVGFFWRHEGKIVACFQHAQTTIASFHAAGDLEPANTLRSLRFVRDFCTLGMPEVLVTCDRKSPLLKAAIENLKMRDVTEKTAFLRLGGDHV